jgi:hypothetical protein
MGRAAQWRKGHDGVVGPDQKCGVNEAAIEAALHGDRLIRRHELAIVTFASGIDQRPARAIGDNELVAVDFGNTPPDGDDAARRQRADGNWRGGRHRDGRAGPGDGNRARSAAKRKQGDSRQSQLAPMTGLVVRGRANVVIVVFRFRHCKVSFSSNSLAYNPGSHDGPEPRGSGSV